MELSNDALFEGEVGTMSGAQIITDVLAADRHTDAIFFAGERMGIGASLECTRLGIDVPGRLALDYEIGHQLIPPLSAIYIPRREIGRLAAIALIDRLEIATGASIRTDVGFQIFDHGST